MSRLRSLGFQEPVFGANYARKAGGAHTSVASLTFRFPDRESAAKALPVVRNLPITGVTIVSRRDLAPSGLGDESAAGLALDMGPFDFFSYSWRVRNVIVFLGSSDPSLGEQGVLEVARRVDHRATRP